MISWEVKNYMMILVQVFSKIKTTLRIQFSNNFKTTEYFLILFEDCFACLTLVILCVFLSKPKVLK